MAAKRGRGIGSFGQSFVGFAAPSARSPVVADRKTFTFYIDQTKPFVLSIDQQQENTLYIDRERSFTFER